MGGYPTAIHFKEMETQGFIQESSAQFQFYKLDLAAAAPLVREGVKAIGTVVQRFGDRFQADERWHHRAWFEQLPPSVSEEDL